MMSSQSLDHGLRRAEHAVAADDAGIVDEDRDLPDLVGDLLRHRDAVFAVGDVEREAFGLAAGVADFLRGLRRRLLVPVEQHDARALAGIAERDRAPDAGACAGDDGDLILEKGHGAFPLLLVLAEDSKRAALVQGGRVSMDCQGGFASRNGRAMRPDGGSAASRMNGASGDSMVRDVRLDSGLLHHEGRKMGRNGLAKSPRAVMVRSRQGQRQPR